MVLCVYGLIGKNGRTRSSDLLYVGQSHTKQFPGAAVNVVALTLLTKNLFLGSAPTSIIVHETLGRNLGNKQDYALNTLRHTELCRYKLSLQGLPMSVSWTSTLWWVMGRLRGQFHAASRECQKDRGEYDLVTLVSESCGRPTTSPVIHLRNGSASGQICCAKQGLSAEITLILEKCAHLTRLFLFHHAYI